jgi:DHA1 family inner membrane transport protein
VLKIASPEKYRSPRSVQSVQVIGVLGNCLAQAKTAAMPLWAASVVTHLQISKGNVGWVSSGEFAAAAIGIAISANLYRRATPRTWALIGTATAIAGNLLSCFSGGWPGLLMGRVIAGLGEGTLYAVSHAVGSRLKNADRGFAGFGIAACLFLIAFTAVGTALSFRFGASGVFGLLLGLCALGAIVFLRLPDEGPSSTLAGEPAVRLQAPSFLIAVALAPLFLVAIGSQGIWPYAAIGAERVGLANSAVVKVLSASLLFGAVANAVAWLLAGRVSPYVPILLGITGLAASVLLFMLSASPTLYVLAMVCGPLGFGLLVPYVYGAMARADPSAGQIPGLGPLASMLGSVMGPPLVGIAIASGRPWLFLAPAVCGVALVLPLLIWLNFLGQTRSASSIKSKIYNS